MPQLKKTIKGQSAPKIKEGVGLMLPTESTPALKVPELTKDLLVAPPGWGKTEFFASNPDALLLACEEGHAFFAGPRMIIDCWTGRLANDQLEPYKDRRGIQHCSFIQAVIALQRDRRYKFVYIDTVDALVKMMLDHTLPKLGVQHASDAGEYGKGWDIAQNTPFRKQLNMILKTGRGVGATTHEQIETKNFKSGQKVKKETSLPQGIYKQIYAQFDIILHGVFGKMPKGEKTRDRYIVTEGSEEILAKNRGGLLPPAFLVPRKFEDRWKQFSGFFTNPETKDKAYQAFLKAGYDLD